MTKIETHVKKEVMKGGKHIMAGDWNAALFDNDRPNNPEGPAHKSGLDKMHEAFVT